MLKVLSLFSGIGAYEKALNNLKIPYEIINYCELNPKKSKAYSLLHNISEDKNLFDVKKINSNLLNDFDLLFYSPPCVNYSIAGKKEGLEGNSGKLFYDALKIIEIKKPKIALMENVSNLVTNFNYVFQDMLYQLEKRGYNNYWKIINAKDYIPQNRNRVFLLSIRKDCDNLEFNFPKHNNNENWFDFINPFETRKLTKNQEKYINLSKINPSSIKIEGNIDFEKSVITLRKSGLRFQSNREHPTITAYYGNGGGNFTILSYKNHIGGITPRQCFKLMGFDYEDCDLLERNGFKTSSLYIMAGDSVVVPIIEDILLELINIKILPN